jgi:hypothetical protein
MAYLWGRSEWRLGFARAVAASRTAGRLFLPAWSLGGEADEMEVLIQQWRAADGFCCKVVTVECGCGWRG